MEYEFDYYLIDDNGLESSPLLIEDEEEGQSAWFLIKETPVEIETPVKLCFNEPIPRKPRMVDYHSMPDSVISKKIYDALKEKEIKGLQLVPVVIRDKNGDDIENSAFRLFHKSVVDIIMSVNPEGIIPIDIEKWYDGEALTYKIKEIKNGY